MTRVSSHAVLSVVAAAAVLTSVAASPQAQATHALRPAAPDRALVLVPVAGVWTADYENANQILTIDGAAPAKAPDEAAARSIYADAAGTLVTSLAAPGAYPIAIARDVKDFKGGRITTQFKLVSGATDQTAGILFNLQPDGSYVYARYNTKDGNVAVWKFEKGARAVLMHGTEHEQLPMNTWHTLEVVVTGRVVAASVNGRLSVRHTLDVPVAGRVGVWTKTDSVTTFRLFQSTHAGHHLP